MTAVATLQYSLGTHHSSHLNFLSADVKQVVGGTQASRPQQLWHAKQLPRIS